MSNTHIFWIILRLLVYQCDYYNLFLRSNLVCGAIIVQFYSCYAFTDMINMVKLDYLPSICCWVYSPGDAIAAIAMYVRDMIFTLNAFRFLSLLCIICDWCNSIWCMEFTFLNFFLSSNTWCVLECTDPELSYQNFFNFKWEIFWIQRHCYCNVSLY